MLEGLQRHQDAALDHHRPEAIAKQHSRGQLTARERIGLLLDENAVFVETGALARPVDPALTAPADAVVVGLGPVHGRTSVIVSFDYTALGGSQGPNNHAKTSRAMKLAQRYDAPVFVLAEGGGARALEMTGIRSGARVLGDFAWLAQLSGRVPLIGVGMGRAFGGHAIFLAECDVIIATKQSAIGVAGPPLVKASTGQDLTPEEIGGAAIHEAAGAIERLVIDDAAALLEAREYARFFLEPVTEYQERTGDVEELRAIAAATGPRDMRRIVELIADQNSLFELRPSWSKEVITSLGRIGGRPVAILATDPRVNSGTLNGPACDKVARFVSLCNAFGIPMLFLVESAGAATDASTAGQALFRHAARISIAMASLDVPTVTISTGPVNGIMQALLGGFGRFLEGPPHFLWPTAEIKGLGTPAVDAFSAAAAYTTDDVIDPGLTRQLVITLFDFAPVTTPTRTRGPIDPW